MSIRENIQFFHCIDMGEYLRILVDEYGAQSHPRQPGAFLIEGLPFYAPQHAEEYTFVLGFNMIPLSHTLIQALIAHPELVPENMLIRWCQEQDLVAEGTVEDFRQMLTE
jgi:hypothetical protein